MDPMGLDIAPSHISSHELTVAHKVLVQRMAATLVAELMEETDLTCQATIALSSYLNLTIISTWCCVYVTESLRHMNLLKIINQNIHQHPIYLLKIVIFNDFKPPFGKGCTLRAAQTVPRKVEPSKGFTQAIRTGSVSEKTATLIRLVLWMHTQCYRIMHNTHIYIYILIYYNSYIYIYICASSHIITYHVWWPFFAKTFFGLTVRWCPESDRKPLTRWWMTPLPEALLDGGMMWHSGAGFGIYCWHCVLGGEVQFRGGQTQFV